MDPIILLSDDSDPEDVIITDVKIRKKSLNQAITCHGSESNILNETGSDEDVVFISSIKAPTKSADISPDKSSASGHSEADNSQFLENIPVTPVDRNNSYLSISDELPDLRSVCDDMWNGSSICQAAGGSVSSIDNHFESVKDKDKQSLKPADVSNKEDNPTTTVNTTDLSLDFLLKGKTLNDAHKTASIESNVASINSASAPVFHNSDISGSIQGQQVQGDVDRSAFNQVLQQNTLPNNIEKDQGDFCIDTPVIDQKNSNGDDAGSVVDQTGNSLSTGKSPFQIVPDIYLLKTRESGKEKSDTDENDNDFPSLSFGSIAKYDPGDQKVNDSQPVADTNETLDVIESPENEQQCSKHKKKSDKGKRKKMKFRIPSKQGNKDEADLSDDDHSVPSFGRCLKDTSKVKVDEGASTSGLQTSPIIFNTQHPKSPVAMVKPLLIRRLSSENLGKVDKKKASGECFYKLAKHDYKKHKKHKREKRLAELREKMKARKRHNSCDDKVFAVKNFDLIMSQLNHNSTVVPKMKLGVTSKFTCGNGTKMRKSGGHNFVCNPPNCNPPNGLQAKSQLTLNLTQDPSSLQSCVTTPSSAPAASLLPWETTLHSDSNHGNHSDRTSPSNPFFHNPAGAAVPPSTESNVSDNTGSGNVNEGTFRKLKLKLDLHSSPSNIKKQKLSDESTEVFTKSLTESYCREDVCYYCGMLKPKAELSSCTKSHVCCGKCLEEHTKALLLGKNHKPTTPISSEKTSDADVYKCCKLLSTIINRCAMQQQKSQVIEATQKLIDRNMEVDAYISTLSQQRIHVKCSSQSMLLHLKKTLPMLRCKLLCGSLEVEHIKPPPMNVIDRSLISQVEEGEQDTDPRSTWSLQCHFPKCNSYFPMSELRKTLPSMVVDMLEEKLDRSFLDFMSDELMKQVDNNPGNTDVVPDIPIKSENEAETIDDSQEIIAEESLIKAESDFPENWAVMSEDKEFEVVTLPDDCEEYVVQSARFYDTMFFPKNEIISIKRVQNPTLWKFYQLRKAKMERDGPLPEHQERILFHGTRKEVVEAICRDNFDFRLSGKHGHAYGQGTYFARDASYSHGYCLDWNTPYMGKMNLPGRLQSRRLISRLKQIRSGSGLTQGLTQGFNSVPSIPLFPSTPPTTNSAQLQLPNISSTTNTTNNTTTLGHNLLQPPPAHQNTTTQSSVNNITLGYNPPPSHALMRSLNTPGLPGHWQNFRNLIVSHTQQPPSQQALVQQLQTPGSNLPVLGMSNSGSSLLSGINPLGNSTDTTFDPQQDRYTYHTMFVARVLVGQCTQGSSLMKRPPPIDPNNEYGKLYDSCVDNVQNPSIFVVFEPQQSYPEYILEYKNMKDSHYA